MTITNIHQPSYTQYHEKGWAGMVAIPAIQPLLIRGFSGSNSIKPGYGLYYDPDESTNGKWKKPSSQAQSLLVHGVVGYEQSNRESATNQSGEIEFSQNDPVKIFTEGVVWVVAGGAINYGDLVRFSHATSGDTLNRWIKYEIADAATASAVSDVDERVDTLRDSLPKRTIFAITEAANAGDLIQVRLSPSVNR